ncbi:hypothetical protein WJX74_002514 [Apatococcus lobatus]|uniref:Tail specific protease domain-containing protein n=1 Tax=Apatococcus lobatus TaxID=904363 RepID=A0AAW1S4C9_9CHLO
MHSQRVALANLKPISRVSCLCERHRPRPAAAVRVLAVSRSEWPSEVFRSCARRLLAAFLAAAVTSTAINASASLPASDLSALSYDLNLKKRNQHGSPDRGFEAALELDEEMFVPDAWNAMQRLRKYSKYVDTLEDAENAPNCTRCKDNRKILEHAWQVVATEYFDAHGGFSQLDWADQLLTTLQGASGLLHNRHETYQAARKMVASLGDKYSEFLAPDQFRRALRRPSPAELPYLAAQLTGVGFSITHQARDGGWLVDAVLAESPAEEAGVVAGERLERIDGFHTSLMDLGEVLGSLRGPAGSRVMVTLGSSQEPGSLHSLFLERRPLPQPPIKQAMLKMLDGRLVQYIRLHYFSSKATRQFTQAMQAGERQQVAGYVLDLRNNPGGVFEEAIYMASMLLEPECRITQTVRNADIIDNTFRVGHLNKSIFPQSPGMITQQPIVLLTNSGTASASEVLAGALHDHHRAVLLGSQTFGKGVVQYYYPMSDGSGLRLTVQKYLTPNQYDISQAGGLPADRSCTDFPHLAMSGGPMDACISAALQRIAQENPGAMTS